MNAKLQRAFEAFDQYNSADPESEIVNGKQVPKALLYGQRMTAKLEKFEPAASESMHLAARCQHIGRWEVARKNYPMDKKGYLQWRHVEKVHQCKLAENILRSCDFDDPVIESVKFLLMKKELQSNIETKLLEDVICLVFVEFYLEEFATRHDDAKVIDILKKTMKKMTAKAIAEVGRISVSEKVDSLIKRAT